MKKFLSVILALALVMSVMLVSCKKETAESLVNGAMEKQMLTMPLKQK